VARILAGCWRADPQPVRDLDAEALAAAAPFLLASGSAALAWLRVRGDPSLAGTPTGRILHDAFRHAALDAAVRERRIAGIAERLASAGVEAVLFKGRAAALAYALPATRPGGDIDLLVRPRDLAPAARLLEDEIRWLAVDLRHDHVSPPAERQAVLERRIHMFMAGTLVAVPSPEDHLRLLCVHALAHGAARPVWLCDVAAWVEGRHERFDWSVALGDDPLTRERVRVAMALSHRLLGMRIDGTPIQDDARLPRWVPAAALRAWANPRTALPMVAWSDRWGIRGRLAALAERWPPDPIADAVENGRPFSGWPRGPFHLAGAASRVARRVGRRPA
jgi:hypothetical protein